MPDLQKCDTQSRKFCWTLSADMIVVRHVKCDEARPACRRCTSTQRACDGYVSSSIISSTLSHTLIISTNRSVGVEPCARSKRSFDLFAHKTCHQLAGFFTSPFWERYILQIAHQEPTIWHMIVAIGSLDEHQAVDTSETRIFALEQYNIAIKSLLRLSRVPESGPRPDLYLIASILFTCFEVGCSGEYLFSNYTNTLARICKATTLLLGCIYLAAQS